MTPCTRTRALLAAGADNRADNGRLSVSCPGQLTTVFLVATDISTVLSSDGVVATQHAVRAVIAAADAFSGARQWSKAEEIYDRAIELASGVEDHAGVREAAAHASQMAWQRGGSGLEHARQVAEWLFTINDATTHDAGEQLLSDVAERAAIEGDATVLRKCLDAAYRASSVAKLEGRPLSQRWPEVVHVLEGRVRSLRPAESQL